MYSVLSEGKLAFASIKSSEVNLLNATEKRIIEMEGTICEHVTCIITLFVQGEHRQHLMLQKITH